MEKVYLDSRNFHNNGLTDEEVLYLLALTNNCNLLRAERTLLEKGLITHDGDINSPMRITEEGATKLALVTLDSNPTLPNEEELYTLVDEMRAIFPKGKKDGAWAWRGSRREIYVRLKKWYEKYGTTVLDDGEVHTWTAQEVLKATRDYVASFEAPNYSKMRVLLYFIMKNPTVNDGNSGYVEVISDLSRTLENPEEQITNWGNNIV